MSLSTKLGKPSSEEARELGQLFPSCSPGPSTSKRVADFDPCKELAGMPNKKRKRKALTSSGRCVNITVCRLPKFTPFIPKGKVRSNLKEKGRLQTIRLTRLMDPSDVKSSIDQAFSHIPSNWSYLETGQDNRLEEPQQQFPDGNCICSRRGCLYIVDKPDTSKTGNVSKQASGTTELCSDGSSDDELPNIMVSRSQLKLSCAEDYEGDVSSSVVLEAKSCRENFMEGLGLERGPAHMVDRKNVFEEVMVLYTDDREKVLSEYPLFIRFKGELGVDLGGVTRDMFSAFFSVAYIKMFDGTSTLFPANHAEVDISKFYTLGTIISHAYLVGSVLPDRVAFPCLVAALLGPQVDIDPEILEEAFVSCLSTHEADILRAAIRYKGKKFPDDMLSELLQILGSYGCRSSPNCQNIKVLMVQAAKYMFLVRPAAAINQLNMGVPDLHRSFWSTMEVGKLFKLYKCMSVSKAKVLSLLEEPQMDTPSKEEVWVYLRQFIGNMTNDELRTFLRFVTGSFVVSVSSIAISFNNLDGLARRPIAHTCTGTLELSTMYNTFLEFQSEFRTVLADPYFSWRMDAI